MINVLSFKIQEKEMKSTSIEFKIVYFEVINKLKSFLFTSFVHFKHDEKTF